MKGYITDYKEKIRVASQALVTRIESQFDVKNMLIIMEELKSFMIKQHSIIESMQGRIELAETFSNPRLSEKVTEQELYIKKLEQQLMISKSNEKMYLSEWTKSLTEKQLLEDKIEVLNLKIDTISFNDDISNIRKFQTVSKPTKTNNVPPTTSEGIIKTISEPTNDLNSNVGNTYNTYNYYGESRTYNRQGQLNARA